MNVKNMAIKTKTVIKQDDENVITKEILAKSIVEIGRGLTAIRKSGLRE